VIDDLLELVWQRSDLAELDPAARRLALRALVAERAEGREVGRLVADLAERIDGFGELGPLMRDEHVTDILVNGSREVWVERAGSLEPTAISFEGERVLELVDRLLANAGARADASHPIADARLADGSRLNVVLPPLAPDGPLVSIRRWPQRPLSLSELGARGMLDESTALWLEERVRARTTIAVSGATSTGKTTLVNALLSCVPEDERVVLIEETPELRPACAHWVSLVARAPNVEGKGGVGLDMLLRTSLRMRPDRIVVGEVRGPEALIALGAMSTGHEGSMVTIHARSAEDSLERMVTLAQQAGAGAGDRVLERQVRSAFGAVVHLDRGPDGARRVASVLTVE
jgi:pilus assembly protein CpaF